jgi:pimeloyl-ACP methyl ester carboxylesterase
METLRAHLGVERFATIGYSYLGLMTVMYAIEYPERVERLVQLGPVPRKFGTAYPAGEKNEEPPAGVAAEIGEAVERMRREGVPDKDPRAFCEKDWESMRYWLVGDPSRVDALGPGHCDLENERPEKLAKGWERRMPEMQKLDLPLDSIRKVTKPVLTVHGTKDRNAPYGAGREWACLLPNARLVTVPGAAHQSWADAPDLVFGSVEAFLEGRWPEAAQRVACRSGSRTGVGQGVR